jgi:hypothetical protein
MNETFKKIARDFPGLKYRFDYFLRNNSSMYWCKVAGSYRKVCKDSMNWGTEPANMTDLIGYFTDFLNDNGGWQWPVLIDWEGTESFNKKFENKLYEIFSELQMSKEWFQKMNSMEQSNETS